MGHESGIAPDLFAWGLILMMVWYFFNGKGQAFNLNSIEIFREEPIQASQTVTATVQATVQPAPEPEVKRNKNGYTELQQDCYDLLKSLGIKTKRERKYIVSETFNKHNPSSVQEFLKLALGK